MKKSLLVLSALVALLLVIVVFAGCGTTSSATTAAGYASNQNTGIWVTGTGKVTVVPDTAVLDMGVQAQAANVADAQTQATQAMSATMAVLTKYNIASADISTQNYSIYPIYSYPKGTQTVTGYSVSNMLSVTIRNLGNVGNILSDVVTAGGDATTINSLAYIVYDPTQDEAAALKLAVADAQNQATQLASEAGEKLGKATYINESGGYNPPAPISFASAAAGAVAPVPVSPGSVDIQVSVQVVYSIS
jgi:hypothetical protein